MWFRRMRAVVAVLVMVPEKSLAGIFLMRYRDFLEGEREPSVGRNGHSVRQNMCLSKSVF